MIVAGNGVRVGQACDALARLAHAIDAPVVTSAAGKGVFPETDPLGAGVMGTFGTATANAIVGEADLVLAVGTKLAPIDSADESTGLIDPSRQVLVQIDVEPLNVSWTFPIDHALIGEAGHLMDQLAAAAGRGRPSANRTPGADAGERRPTRRTASSTAASSPRDEVPIAPQRTIRLLQETFPEDGIVTCDAGREPALHDALVPAQVGQQLPPTRSRGWHGLRGRRRRSGRRSPTRTGPSWRCAGTAASPCPCTPS